MRNIAAPRRLISTAVHCLPLLICAAAGACRIAQAQLGQYGVPFPRDYQSALTAFDNGDFDASFPTLYRYAQKGDPEAQFRVGRMYADGKGAAMDDEIAMRFFEAAAKQGHPPALVMMGMRYKEGRGLPKDPEKAFQYMAMAADKGDAKAKYYLGIMYRDGIGTAKNPALARQLIQQSADAGDTKAQMTVVGVQPGDWDGAKGTTRSQEILSEARTYYYAKDFPTALRLLLESAKLGNAQAATSAAYQFRNGEGTPKNNAEAFRWFRFAGEHGNANAYLNLGGMYQSGDGVQVDFHQAMAYYKKCANVFYADCVNEMSRLYEFGLGVPPDRGEAVRLALEAGKLGNSQGAYFGKWLSEPTNMAFNNDADREVYQQMSFQRFEIVRNNVMCGPGQQQYCVEMVFYHVEPFQIPSSSVIRLTPGKPFLAPAYLFQ
jgi:TPR repeat protein